MGVNNKIPKLRIAKTDDDALFIFEMFKNYAIEKNIFVKGNTIREKIKYIYDTCFNCIYRDDFIGLLGENIYNKSCVVIKLKKDKAYIIFSRIDNKDPFVAKKAFYDSVDLINKKFGIKLFYSDASKRDEYDNFIAFLTRILKFNKTGRGGDENYELIYG